VSEPGRSVAVIGGGLTGLSAAYDLALAGATVTLYEQADQLGGLAVGGELAGYPVEKAYHFIYKTDADIIALAEELGLGEQLVFHDSSLATYVDGRLWPFMTPLDLLRFKPLAPWDRLRAGATALYLQRVKRWQKLTRVTADAWLRRWAGRRVTDVLWAPLLEGKFDRYFDKVTMAWLWGRIKVRVDSKEAGEVIEKLGYFEGGFAVLVDSLASRVRELGGDIRVGVSVDELDHDQGAGGPWLRIEGEIRRFDAVVCTVPTNVFSRITSSSRHIDPLEREKLEGIDYLGAVVYVFATKEPITDYYWHNISERGAPFVVFLTLTNLVGSEAFGGLHVHYIGDYVPHEHPYFSMAETDLTDLWKTELAARFDTFDPDDVVDGELVRLANAQHVVDVGFEDRIPRHRTSVPGVYLANFTQIYPQDRGTNYAVAQGREMATMVLSDLSGPGVDGAADPTDAPR